MPGAPRQPRRVVPDEHDVETGREHILPPAAGHRRSISSTGRTTIPGDGTTGADQLRRTARPPTARIRMPAERRAMTRALPRPRIGASTRAEITVRGAIGWPK